MKRAWLALSLGLALASPAALARCGGGGVPSPHGGDSRDSYGMAWYSRPVCYRAEFAPGGLTLDAEARAGLSQRLEGARRLYRTDCVAVAYGPEQPDHDAARVAYLRWWLGLQQVALHLDPPEQPRWSADSMPARGGDSVELQITRCR